MAAIAGIDITSFTSGALNVIIMIVSVVLGLAFCVGMYFIYRNWKKYQAYVVEIYEPDGTISYDQAGVFLDSKTKNLRFHLKKNKVGLSPDELPQYSYRVPGNKRKVFLLRTSRKGLQFVKVEIDDPVIKYNVGDEDINWAVNSYERQKALFADNKWMALIPFIAIAFVSIIILIIFIYFFKDFAVLKEVAVAFRDAATALAQAQSGTTVIPGT